VGAKKLSVILVMGVSGSGKTTIGKLLAKHLKGTFLDADDFHPGANIEKMTRGEPLNDEDRWPWLDAIAVAVQEHTAPRPLVLACSALKDSYRDRLRLGANPIVFLTGSRETIAHRLSLRHGHFMPAPLLDSQIIELEEPKNAMTVSISSTPAKIVDQILTKIEQ
jgi:gluconokinase